MTDERTLTGSRVLWSRRALAGLAAVFVLGALLQFFLAGMAVFDGPERWADHEMVGHVVGLLSWFLWIPAVMGRAGRRVVIAAVAVFVLFGGQYGFVAADQGAIQALHPLNGSVLLLVAGWIAVAGGRLARESAADIASSPPHRVDTE